MVQTSATKTTQSGSAGCFAILSGAVSGASAGIIATLFGLGPIVGLVIAVGVAWLAIRSLSSHAPPTPDRRSDREVQPEIRLADGSAFRDARGLRTNGGATADTALPGTVMVTLPFEPEGVNADALISLLSLVDGRVGYRDGLTIPTDDDLVVYAMARLTSDVEATGDSDVGAAPVGRIPGRAWADYPQLGPAPSLVQVALCIDSDNRRRGWILFTLRT